jgi:hypothetical protein
VFSRTTNISRDMLLYLEDIALYFGDAGSIEDDGKQSNAAESGSLDATIAILSVINP